MKRIELLDLPTAYTRQKKAIDEAIQEVIVSSDFIQGKAVTRFEKSLAGYLGTGQVIGVGNGTDALQIALLALGLQRGDEVIVPSFTYFASAEAIAFLGFVPVFVDVDLDTFTLNAQTIKNAISVKTKAVIVVHLYGRSVTMEPVLQIAKKNSLFVIEDVAQALGGDALVNGENCKLGTIGDIGCTSFFPSKNLGGFGDGGAIFSKNTVLIKKARMIANHGQSKKYVHDFIGVNSRLDSLQAAVLSVKLVVLDEDNKKRQEIARFYTKKFQSISQIISPIGEEKEMHVFHQYTIRLKNYKDRDLLKSYLREQGVPSRVYYPIPVHQQRAMKGLGRLVGSLENTQALTESILSLPMHPELDQEQLRFITNTVHSYFKKIA